MSRTTIDIETVYRAHGHAVLRRAKQILGDEQEALEVLQEIFVSLVDRPEQFAGRSSITTWLYSATTHLCLNKIRNRRNRDKLLELHVVPLASDTVADQSEAFAAARRLLASMPQDLALVTAYYYFDELSHQEIAEVLGCSRRHVGNLLGRAQAWAKQREAA